MLNNIRSKQWDEIYENVLFPIRLVAIETIGNCNRRCSFCPVSKSLRRNGKLDISFIESIFLQLKKLGYSNQLRLHYYNEPLLDDRLYSIIRLLRKYLHENFLRLTTNGDFLNLEVAKKLIDCGVSEIKVSIYSKKASNKLNEVLTEDIMHSLPIKLVKYYDNFIITNRGGMIKKTDVQDANCKVIPGASINGCNRLEFNIDYLGNVYPCCHCFDGSYLLGNIHENSLIEIYINNKQNFRDHFIGKYSQAVCRKCVGISV